MARPKNDGMGRMGGRAKGTPNQTTSDLKEWITSILENGKDEFITRLGKSDDRDYIKTFVGLLNYVIPKQASTTPDDILRKEILQDLMLSNAKSETLRLRQLLNELSKNEGQVSDLDT